MLMHEWRKYRERQIRKVIQEARTAEPPPATDETSAASATEAESQALSSSSLPSASSETEEKSAASEGARRNASAALPLKSAPSRPKQILEQLTAGNEEIRERLEALDFRQQVLPLDIEAAAPPRKRSRRVTESREELVQRLMDPVLTLEEAAILLDVCPTTVRRYTNRGVLKCFRTPGNQRRFRLSEILSFMERRQRGLPLTKKEEDEEEE